jgi:hypothetical protein
MQEHFGGVESHFSQPEQSGRLGGYVKMADLVDDPRLSPSERDQYQGYVANFGAENVFILEVIPEDDLETAPVIRIFIGNEDELIKTLTS